MASGQLGTEMRAAALFLALVPGLLASTSIPLETLLKPAQLINSNADTSLSYCVHPTLAHCQNSFNNQLNISSNLDWTNPNILSSELSAYYIRGVSGLIAVCGARQQFQACLGDQYAACMSVPRFVNDGQNPISASQYVQLFKELEFDCNGGFVQAVQNYDCILDVWLRHGQDLVDCYNAFNVTLTKDPNSYCSASYQAEKCTRTPFQVTCGAEASWWQCERTRVGAGLDQLCPTNYCQVQQSSPRSAYSARRSEAVQDVMKGSKVRNEVMSQFAEKARLRERK